MAIAISKKMEEIVDFGWKFIELGRSEDKRTWFATIEHPNGGSIRISDATDPPHLMTGLRREIKKTQSK